MKLGLGLYLQEMAEGDVYQVVERYAALGKIAYIHFRNVRGNVPNYLEIFVDEGDIDMARIVQTYAPTTSKAC